MCSGLNNNRWFLFEKVKYYQYFAKNIFSCVKCDFFWRFWPKNWNSWSHDIETFHTEKSGVLEEKPQKRKILRRQLFMLKLATIRSDQSQSSTPGQSPDGSPVLKYFLYETIHNGNRGTHFTKFLISNFLRGLTYSIYTTILILTMNIINILVAISSFASCFLHNQDKKEHYNFFFFRFSLTATVPCWLPFNMEDHPLLQASFNNKLEYKIEKTKYFPCFIQNPTWFMAQSLTKGVLS